MLILLAVLNLFVTNNATGHLAPASRLTVDVQNVVDQEGAVYIALFKPNDDFPEGKPYEGKRIKVAGNQVQTTFTIEPGTYAVAVFHDKNSNGKMDKRLFGIPKEPYGLSNNFHPKMSAPKFKDCQFTVGSDAKTINIKLN